MLSLFETEKSGYAHNIMHDTELPSKQHPVMAVLRLEAVAFSLLVKHSMSKFML
jgi:hypothetical protein